MPTVPDVHRRGTRAAQPAAATVTIGTLYFVTDESVTERSNGTTWETYSGAAMGGGGAAPLTAPYLVATADPSLTAERVITNTGTVTWDISTPGQVKANVVNGVVLPDEHAMYHEAGGSDALALDRLAPPTDITTLNASASAHGLLPKLSGLETQFLTGTGGWATPVAPPPSGGTTTSTFLVSGGQVTWEAAYTFRVSAAQYYINGVALTSVEAVVTLGAAHATLDRLDVIALNTSGAVVVLAGTPASTPSEPSVDPAAYLKLAIVLVAHATTAPPTVQQVTVYTENAGAPAEWAWTSSGPAIILNSTTTPHAGTTAIEGTNVPAGVYAQGTSGAGTIDPNTFDHLLLFVRVKSAWNNSRGLLVTLRASGVLVGATVQIRRSGTFGFDGTLTTAYQQVAIPITAFAVPQGTLINQVRIEDFGGAIGFYLDDLSFQATGTTSVGGGITQDQADARYAPLVHAPRHANGGADPLKLDDLAAPDDNTDLNASATTHGLLRKLSGTATEFLNGAGAWVVPSPVAPAAHHTTHEAGGTDTIKLDDLAAPDDTTDLNATASAHGLLRKLSGNASDVLKGDGTWGAGSGGAPSAHHTTHEAGGSDAITALDAAVITTGTIATARLPARIGVVGVALDGGGTVLTTGVKGFVQIPVACTITGWTILSTDSAATAGSIVFDVWKDTYAAYPPTVADTITAAAKPTLSSANKNTSTTLTGWTTAIAAGDVLGFSVDSVATVTRVVLTLTVQAS